MVTPYYCRSLSLLSSRLQAQNKLNALDRFPHHLMSNSQTRKGEEVVREAWIVVEVALDSALLEPVVKDNAVIPETVLLRRDDVAGGNLDRSSANRGK